MPGYLLEGTRLPFETNREDNFIKYANNVIEV
jgi:hypothetical protein